MYFFNRWWYFCSYESTSYDFSRSYLLWISTRMLRDHIAALAMRTMPAEDLLDSSTTYRPIQSQCSIPKPFWFQISDSKDLYHLVGVQMQ